MAQLSFDDLIELYKNSRFNDGTNEGLLTITSAGILETVRLIDGDEVAAEDSRITFKEDTANLSIKDQIHFEYGSPRMGLGALADDFGDLLKTHKYLTQEPTNYYLKKDRIEKNQDPPHDTQIKYRNILQFIDLLKKASIWHDDAKREVILLDKEKHLLSIEYDHSDIESIDTESFQKIFKHFSDSTHEDQKLEILIREITEISRYKNKDGKFKYILKNLNILCDHVIGGYKAFISNFSYRKIKSEIEKEKVEFINRIHKTFVDIQGQLLGIPITSIIVGSQMDFAPLDESAKWANLAILFGACVFALLFTISALNQWMTLDAITDEIKFQRDALKSKYNMVASHFTETFEKLLTRTNRHKFALIVVVAIAWGGVYFAHHIYNEATSLPRKPNPPSGSFSL